MTSLFAELSSRGAYRGATPSPDRPEPSVVFVVADDERVRRSLERLLDTTESDIESCSSAAEFLSLPRPTVPCCLLLGVSRRAADGLELQRRISGRTEMSIVVVTSRPDVHATVQAMKAGAVDVLARPLDAELLSRAVDTAIERSRAALLREAALRTTRERYASLTPREREVMELVVSGLLNKQAAYELGLSEITVKAHRGQVMRKMNADSLPHLVRMAASLEASA